jgi:hypothetical protein
MTMVAAGDFAARIVRRTIGAFAIAAAVVIFAMPALAQDLDERSERTRDIFGEPFGLALIVGVEKACPHARKVAGIADPAKRTLLMTDEAVTQFHQETCDGICTFAQTNAIVTRCRSDRGIAGCVIYGAAYDKKLYDVSIDPTGGSIAKNCAF